MSGPRSAATPAPRHSIKPSASKRAIIARWLGPQPCGVLSLGSVYAGSRWLVTSDQALRERFASFEWDTTVLVLGEAA